jgi:DNA-binding NarL/FixJ family response regulator
VTESTEHDNTSAPAGNDQVDTGNNQAGKKKILLVDDHPIFRHGLTELLDRQVDLVVCGHADSAPTALEQMRQLKPDLAILDITLQGTNGIELVKLMKAEAPHLPILVLSMHDESLYALRALKAGALGYVMKADGVQPVLDAIYRALQGKVFVSKRLGEKLIFKAIHASESDSPSPSPVDRLSDRELEVLVMLGRGHSTRSIAKEINLSVKTVETHRAHIKEKLGFADANEMVRFAIDWVAHQELS